MSSVTVYGVVNIRSIKVLQLWNKKFNPADDVQGISLVDFCHIYNRFGRMDHLSEDSTKHRDSFLEFVRPMLVDQEKALDKMIDKIKAEFENPTFTGPKAKYGSANNYINSKAISAAAHINFENRGSVEYPQYTTEMFEHVTPGSSVFTLDDYKLDVIWNWRVIWRLVTIVNKIQYLTILCELARREFVISKNELSSVYRKWYVMPLHIILTETKAWIEKYGDVPEEYRR